MFNSGLLGLVEDREKRQEVRRGVRILWKAVFKIDIQNQLLCAFSNLYRKSPLISTEAN